MHRGSLGIFSPRQRDIIGGGRVWTAADDETSLHLRAAIQRRRRRVNTLWARCESNSPETLSNTCLNGPEPLTVPEPGSPNPSPLWEGALHLAHREGRDRGRGGRPAGVITNSPQQEANAGKQWPGQCRDYGNVPSDKSRISTVWFGLKISSGSTRSVRALHFNYD